MKIGHKIYLAQSHGCLHGGKEDGFVATVLFVGLLAIMLMLATAGGMALVHLHDEVRVLEQQQIKKFNMPATNSVPVSHQGITRVDVK
jgi:hypothetical protein